MFMEIKRHRAEKPSSFTFFASFGSAHNNTHYDSVIVFIDQWFNLGSIYFVF